MCNAVLGALERDGLDVVEELGGGCWQQALRFLRFMDKGANSASYSATITACGRSRKIMGAGAIGSIMVSISSFSIATSEQETGRRWAGAPDVRGCGLSCRSASLPLAASADIRIDCCIFKVLWQITSDAMNDDPPATDVAMEGASEAAESSAPATATDAAAAVDAAFGEAEEGGSLGFQELRDISKLKAEAVLLCNRYELGNYAEVSPGIKSPIQYGTLIKRIGCMLE
ncbi:unnamed protein product [Symbiodinium sp. KB8]|nr:unnamed protein product [Symbiodinium sp. KB8]